MAFKALQRDEQKLSYYKHIVSMYSNMYVHTLGSYLHFTANGPCLYI